MRRVSLLLAILMVASVPLAASSPDITPREAIGWKLFFDPMLSRPQNTSCGTCHDPAKGFEQGEALGKGAHGDVLPRNTPTVVNLHEASSFFWDGRSESLEEQAKGPITNPIEMDMTLEEVVARVQAQPHYQRAFAASGVENITIEEIVGAIAAFERKLVTGETVFDRWLDGDRGALDDAQERGRMIFFTRGQCAICHLGRNLTDGDFHNIATGTKEDLGRYTVDEDDYYKGAFKPPSLRNWKGREPFMHDGRFATLREVIEHYNDPPEAEVGESELEPLNLSEVEISDLLAFMETLNGEWPDLKPFESAWNQLAGE